jgi:hypothetical protein
MSKIDLYKNNFPNHFSEKTVVSIMMRIVKKEKRVVSTRFFEVKVIGVKCLGKICQY